MRRIPLSELITMVVADICGSHEEDEEHGRILPPVSPESLKALTLYRYTACAWLWRTCLETSATSTYLSQESLVYDMVGARVRKTDGQ